MSVEAPDEKKQQTGLQEFKDVVTDFKSLGGYVVKGSSVLPFADYLAKLGPAWPVPAAGPIITAVTELLALMAAFHFWAGLTPEAISRRFRIAITLLVCFFVGYSVLTDQFTFVPPGPSKVRHSRGFSLTEDARTLTNPPRDVHVPPQKVDDILAGHSYEASYVWTPGSILLVDLGLLALWQGMFISLVAAITAFILYYRRKGETAGQ